MRIALSFAILVALGSAARAGDNVGVIVDGEGSTPQLTAQLADWLTRHGYTPVLSPLSPETVSLFTDAMKLGNQASARDVLEKHAQPATLVYARVDIKGRTGGGRELALTVYWLVKGRDATSQSQDCARCTDQLLRASLEELLKKLIGGGGIGHIKLKSSPPGARITIDGQPIGVTPLDWDLPTGKHTIQMDKAGLVPATRDVVIASDKLELVVLTLDPVAAGEASAPRSRVVPAVILAAGVAGLAAGVTLIAIDEDPSGKARTYRDTRPAGIGVAIGGAVVTGIGGYLLLRTRRTSAPVAAITRDAAYVGWLGRF